MGDIDLRTRALRLAEADELKLAVADPHVLIIEWGTVGLTFLRSDRNLIIARTGIMGGDVRHVHGGWMYLSLFQMRIDWSEIRYAAEAFTPPTELGGVTVRGGPHS